MQSFSRGWLAWSDRFDLLLTPAVGVPPLPIGAYRLSAGQRRALQILTALPKRVLLRQRPKILEAFRPMFDAAPYTMFANVTGQPSVSLPLHWTAHGLPMGMLFTARPADEATLFRIAGQLEQILPWAERRAPLAPARPADV
jgi:amidase